MENLCSVVLSGGEDNHSDDDNELCAISDIGPQLEVCSML